jgi:hypothetical protein
LRANNRRRPRAAGIAGSSEHRSVADSQATGAASERLGAAVADRAANLERTGSSLALLAAWSVPSRSWI